MKAFLTEPLTYVWIAAILGTVSLWAHTDVLIPLIVACIATAATLATRTDP